MTDSEPKANEVWRVKIFHRTYWREATVKLIAVNPYRPGFGWLYHTRIGGVQWSESAGCRLAAHIKFIAKVS